MILTVTPNTAVDRTYTVENFRIDRINRASISRVIAGGKGVNVARWYQELGGRALATGFVGGHHGNYIVEALHRESISSDFVRTEGESRICTKVMDPVQKTQTELNEVGPEISPDEVERLRVKFESLVSGMEYVVLCGSLPPGAPDTIYRELIEIAHHYKVPCVLDSSGAPLEQGLEAQPYMAKPNAHELSSIMDHQLGTVEEAAEAAETLVDRGIQIVAVTFGRDGAIVVTRGGAWRSRPPEIQFVSAVGSGDAFAAAFVYSLSQCGDMSEALRMGTAVGTANAMCFDAGTCTREIIAGLADQVEVSELR
jgi:1-phosphofructokinase family hexose kinase